MMRITPTPDGLPELAGILSGWQYEPWAGHLHPGDLGWHSLVGADQTATDLRVWMLNGDPVAIGMLDGGEVLRMAVDPAKSHDAQLATLLAGDVEKLCFDMMPSGAIVEARGAVALRGALTSTGWREGESWTPLSLALTDSLDLRRLDRSEVRVEEVGPGAAEDWTSVHWSAFKGRSLNADASTRLIRRWRTMTTGPFADRAHNVLAYSSEGTPVAIATAWSAGPGRPGLLEPMGVHHSHHGRGLGVAITLAAAAVLKQHGASSAVVVAENSNVAALSTYLSAGFTSLGSVADLSKQ